MGDERLNVLLVEDTASLAALYQAYLQDEPLSLTVVNNGQAAIEYIQQHAPDILLLDLILPDMPGMDILQWLHREKLNITTIVITAHGSVDVAVDAMRLGAHDFINKPIEIERLKVTLHNTMKFRQLNQLLDSYRHDIAGAPFQGFIGASLPMQKVYRLIDNAAPSSATVFITGESGTGKEVCAEALHQRSGRPDGPFIALNCAAIPKDLMESELFGHEAGAFAGAMRPRYGKFEHAQGGTVLLDEIGSMPLALQGKLLRVLQERVITRLGSNDPVALDLRFIATSKSDLAEAVAAGTTVVDVRTPAEFDDGAIPRALNIPVDELRERLEELPAGELVVYCAVGIRGHVAARVLSAAGRTVRNLDGGYRTWRAGTGAGAERVDS